MKRYIFVFVLLFALTTPAHGALFYEFNPDYSQSILIATSDPVSELFLPLNDYLGAFDFWVSNGGVAGDATFTLYNPTGSVLAERTIAVPAIPDSPDGTRLRLALPNQIAVTGNAAYRVRITSTSPTLRLYYSDATRLLAHNGSPLPAYAGGLARIGSDDMGFSFKFALYENKESTPPQLTNVAVTNESTTRSTITFNANEPVDRTLLYGTGTIAYNGEYSSCTATIQSCSISLPVSPASTYTYTLTVQDVWGNQTTATGTFTSLGEPGAPTPTPTATLTPTATPTPTATTPPDTTPPTITNARLVSSTATSATFAWTTDEAASALVIVQSLPYFLSEGANSDSTLELEHFIRVEGLSSDTLFRATLTSNDIGNNQAKTTIDFNTPRQTISPSASPAPSPGVTGAPAASTATPAPSATPGIAGPSNNPELTWSAPAGGEPTSGYRIDIFDSENKLVKSIAVPQGQRSVALGQLPVGENRVVVYANNDGVFEKVAAPMNVSSRSSRSFMERIIPVLPAILIGIVVAIGAIITVMKLRSRKTPPPPSPSAPTQGASGAVMNPSSF